MNTTVQLQRQLPMPRERAALERNAKLLAWGGNAWHVVEFAIAVGAGIAAGSVALVGFGIDSVIEALAGGVIVWLFSGGRGSSHRAERRAQKLIAASYAILVVYIAVEAIRDFAGSHHPGVSWVESASPPSRRRQCRCSPAPSASSVAGSTPQPRSAKQART